ncbi:MarR family winged helix-turn-helix transcriptional regulator [Streptomyces sp. NPDC017991]|uniref:MarR family winged helix-turn-helix transcriptional regulator n=1 Tax=Streptomyces sp. NPDC017991 TaxID=3365026 RepID=UPI0037BC2A16
MADTDEPDWLSKDELWAWQALATVLMRLPGILDTQLQRDAGINFFEYLVLSGLSMAPDRTMRMSELADAAQGSLSRLSQGVARLEKRGWVRRCPDPADGRYTLATLTNDGLAMVTATAPGHAQAVRRHVISPLTKTQQRQLQAISNRIVDTFDY